MYVGGPINFEDAGVSPFGRGRADPLETRPSPHVLQCLIWLFQVRGCERTYGDRPETSGPSCLPFKVTEGHRNRHGSIGYR